MIPALKNKTTLSKGIGGLFALFIILMLLINGVVPFYNHVLVPFFVPIFTEMGKLDWTQIVIGHLNKFLSVIMAVITMWLALSMINLVNGKSWRKDILPIIMSNPDALAKYNAAKFLGIALLVAIIYG